MNDPTIVTLDRDHPDPTRDQYWVNENLESAARQLDKSLPARYREAIADHVDVVAWVKELVATSASTRTVVPTLGEGPSLLLLGKVGRGKTYQAWGAIRALAATGLRVWWEVTTAADLYAILRRPKIDTEAEFQRFASTRLLVLDDLGASKVSEWTEQETYRLVNHRYERQLPTLFTSNLLPKQLGEVLGDRIASRMVEMTQRVVLEGEDRRRAS
jgi:DNA replication protein DnaC